MAHNTVSDAWQRNIEAQRGYKFLYPLLIAIMALMIGFWLGLNSFDDQQGYQMNVFTELLSIGITVFVIDRLNAWRDEQNLRKSLIRDAGSRDNSTALSAIDRLLDEGWLTGEKSKLLEHASLRRANWSGAYMRHAKLAHVDLYMANLDNINLRDADLSSAYIRRASMIESYLGKADLTEAVLREGIAKQSTWQRINLTNANMLNLDLANADLRSAILLGATLTGANLMGTTLRGAQLNQQTIFPDGTQWSSNTDMTRFTNSDHPNFWRSDDPKSPAYKGQD